MTYNVAASNSVNSRTGTLTLGDKTFTVTQSGVTGSVTLSPTSDTETAAGATGKSVSVTANAPDYTWTATSNAAWLTITSSASITGSGTVTYNVAANTGTASRAGTLTLGGQTFTVTQAGLTPAQGIAGLIGLIRSFNLAGGAATSLIAPLQNIDTSNLASACNKMAAFVNMVGVKLQNGELTQAQATQLVTAANLIQTSLGCTI